jgi:hypothetical protein
VVQSRIFFGCQLFWYCYISPFILAFPPYNWTSASAGISFILGMGCNIPGNSAVSGRIIAKKKSGQRTLKNIALSIRLLCQQKTGRIV